MDRWVVLGEFYVRPVDWEELHVIQPEGAVYSVYRHHLVSGERILIGTAPTPAAAARLIDDSLVSATGGQHDPRERRRQAGLM